LIDLSQYLPILIFLGVALGLSSAFVVLPIVASRLTGSYEPNADKLSEYECGFPPLKNRAVSLTCASIWWRSCSSCSIWKRPSCSLGCKPEGNRLGRLDHDDGVPAELVIGFAYAWKKGALDWE
jgi:NADH-quinone oxidoreductase subunit A